MSSFKELLGKYGFPQIFLHFLPICADNTTRKSNIFTTHLAFSNWELFTACGIWNTDDMEQASVYHYEALALLATSGLALTCTSAPEWMQFTPVWLNCQGSPWWEIPLSHEKYWRKWEVEDVFALSHISRAQGAQLNYRVTDKERVAECFSLITVCL